ncbi:MAG: tetratricopeptide repeat protein [Bacteroidota bacterium]
MKKVIVLLAVLGYSVSVQANTIDSLRVVLAYEEDPDSIIKTQYLLARELVYASEEEFMPVIESAETIAIQNTLYALLPKIFYLKGYYYHQNNNSLEAYKQYAHAKLWAESEGDPLILAMSNSALGFYLRKQGDYESANQLLNKSLALAIELEDWSLAASSQHELGRILSESENYSASENALLLALGYYKRLGEKSSILLCQIDLGEVLRKNGDWESARSQYLAVLSQAQDQHNADFLRGMCLNNLGQIEEHKGNLEQAKRYYNQSAGAHTLSGETNYLLISMNNQANLALAQEDFEAVAQLTHSIEDIDPNAVDPEQLIHAFDLRSESLEKLGLIDLALKTERRRNGIETSYQLAEFEKEQVRQVYEVMAAQAQLEVMDIQEARIAERQYWWVAIVAILLLAAVGIYVMHRKAMRHKAKAEANATHWPELDKRMQALEDALNVLY